MNNGEGLVKRRSDQANGEPIASCEDCTVRRVGERLKGSVRLVMHQTQQTRRAAMGGVRCPVCA